MKPSFLTQESILTTNDMCDMSSLTSSYEKRKPDESDVSAAMETVARYIRSLAPNERMSELKIFNDKINLIDNYAAMSSSVSSDCHVDSSESKK